MLLLEDVTRERVAERLRHAEHAARLQRALRASADAARPVVVHERRDAAATSVTWTVTPTATSVTPTGTSVTWGATSVTWSVTRWRRRAAGALRWLAQSLDGCLEARQIVTSTRTDCVPIQPNTRR